MREEALAGLAGTRLTEGTFTLSAEDHRRFSECVLAGPGADPTVTALWLVVSNLRGLGIELTDVFALAGCDMVADGPMLGGCEMEIARPLEPGRPYAADGEIIGIARKSGRRSGTFDVMRVRVGLSDEDGEAAAATMSYVLPRRTA
jgi:hypothetical protein